MWISRGTWQNLLRWNKAIEKEKEIMKLKKMALLAVCTAWTSILLLPAGLASAEESDTDTAEESVVATEADGTEAETVEQYTSGEYTYTLKDDGTASIYQCITESTDLVVPSELDGYTVTEIGGGAFVNQDSLVTVTLPKTLEVINDSCFFGCTSLQEFIVEDGNTKFTSQDGILFSADGKYLICYPIGNEATSYTVPDGVVEIWSSAFAKTNLTSVTFPDSLLYIDDWTFSYVPLESLELPDSLLEIGDDAFIYCNGLTELILPPSLEIIGCEAFAGCENLETVELPDGLQTVKMSAFAGTAMKEVTIPSSVQDIGFSAFGYEADTVTQVDGFIIYGTVGSQAQSYCTASDAENDYANNFTFRSVMSEEVDSESTEVQAEEEKTSIWQQYGKWILMGCVILVLLVAGIILLCSGKTQKDSVKETSKKKAKSESDQTEEDTE